MIIEIEWTDLFSILPPNLVTLIEMRRLDLLNRSNPVPWKKSIPYKTNNMVFAKEIATSFMGEEPSSAKAKGKLGKIALNYLIQDFYGIFLIKFSIFNGFSL